MKLLESKLGLRLAIIYLIIASAIFIVGNFSPYSARSNYVINYAYRYVGFPLSVDLLRN